MITFAEACKIAKEAATEAGLGDKHIVIVEISDRWFFAFLSYDPKEEPDRTCFPFWVYKEDGDVEWFTAPPVDQWEELQNGKQLEFISEEDR